MARDGGSPSWPTLLDLPNEILFTILFNFTTLPLLHMRLVSHRFQSVILRIVRCRLLLAASLEDRKLILECYHPSAQYSEPYLYCDYLGTPGLGDCVADRGSLSEEIEVGGDGQMLQKLYSRFRPTRRDPQFKGRQPHPAGDVPGSRTSDAAEEFERKQTTDEPIKRVVSLDAHENFSQLVLNTDLVQLGPRRGVFLDILRVTEKKTLRIFREWMAQRIRKSSKTAQTGAENGRRGTSEDFSCELEEPDRTLWIDEVNKSAGLKVGIEERRWRRTAPLLMRRDEEEAVSYSIEIQELQISTVHLLLAIERNLLEKERGAGQEMVFTSFRSSS